MDHLIGFLLLGQGPNGDDVPRYCDIAREGVSPAVVGTDITVLLQIWTLLPMRRILYRSLTDQGKRKSSCLEIRIFHRSMMDPGKHHSQCAEKERATTANKRKLEQLSMPFLLLIMVCGLTNCRAAPSDATAFPCIQCRQVLLDTFRRIAKRLAKGAL